MSWSGSSCSHARKRATVFEGNVFVPSLLSDAISRSRMVLVPSHPRSRPDDAVGRSMILLPAIATPGDDESVELGTTVICPVFTIWYVQSSPLLVHREHTGEKEHFALAALQGIQDLGRRACLLCARRQYETCRLKAVSDRAVSPKAR